jgi:crotonobetainyl-CoA:carnitine CoA-transferase CaiB-like acyl-CoA transferase
MRRRSVNVPRPLNGILVAEIDASVALAFCGKYLAGLGARVSAYGDRPTADTALRDYLDDGKHIVPSSASSEAWAGADIVLASRRPAQVDERTIVVVITDTGAPGAPASRPAGDLLAQARAGLMSLVGTAEGAPLPMGGHQISYTAGMAAFTAAMIALHARDRDGRGQVVETSLVEVAAYIEWKGRLYEQVGRPLVRGDNSGPIITRCGDGHFGFYYRETDWPAIRQVLDSELLDDDRFATHAGRVAHASALAETISDLCRDVTRDDLYRRLQAVGVPAGPIYDASDLHESAQYRERGFLVPLRDSAGVQPALPVTFNAVRSAAPERHAS